MDLETLYLIACKAKIIILGNDTQYRCPQCTQGSGKVSQGILNDVGDVKRRRITRIYIQLHLFVDSYFFIPNFKIRYVELPLVVD